MGKSDNKYKDQIQNESCISCKAKSLLFHLLTKEELLEVNENRCQVKYKAGETIRKQGAHLSHVISVTGGLCKMYIEGIESRDIILRIIKPTNFIGGPGLYVDSLHHFTVTAIVDTTVCFIDTKIFKLIMSRNKDFADAFMQDMSTNMISIYNRIISLTQKQMAGRVADALIYFSDDVFESKEFEIPLSNQEIADFTQMTKDNLVRIMKSLNHENTISQTDNIIRIVDYKKLLRISATG